MYQPTPAKRGQEYMTMCVGVFACADDYANRVHVQVCVCETHGREYNPRHRGMEPTVRSSAHCKIQIQIRALLLPTSFRLCFYLSPSGFFSFSYSFFFFFLHNTGVLFYTHQWAVHIYTHKNSICQYILL